MAQQGPPPRRRSSRPSAPGRQDQPGGPGWQDPQPAVPSWQNGPAPIPAWQDPQAQPPAPGWQDQQDQQPWQEQPPWQDPQPGQGQQPWQDPQSPAPGWQDPQQPAPARHGRHSQPPAAMPGPPTTPVPAPGWQGQQVQTDMPAPAWPDRAVAPEWPEQPVQPPAPSWQDQPLRGRPATYNPDDPDDDLDEDTPPWAGMSVTPRRPHESRPPHSSPQPDADLPAEEAPRGLTRRAIATRARKARRKLLIGGGTAIAVALLAAGGWVLFGPKAPVHPVGEFINTFQAGELRTVPNACRAISGSVLSQYLPGQPTRVATAALNGASESQCTWTLDNKPVYRVLEVTSQAFAPSGLNTGDGSATSGAIDNFGAQQQALTHPAKKSHLPAATVTPVPGLGAQAFSALQVIKGGGNVTDLVTLVVRDRNVVITVALQGLGKSAKGHYGPVSIAQLRAGSIAAAREALAGLK